MLLALVFTEQRSVLIKIECICTKEGMDWNYCLASKSDVYLYIVIWRW